MLYIDGQILGSKKWKLLLTCAWFSEKLNIRH